MAECESTCSQIEIHIKTPSNPKTTTEEVASALKQYGLKESDVKGANGDFSICTSENVATKILKQKDEIRLKGWSVSVPAVSVTVTYCDEIYTPADDRKKLKDASADSSKIDAFLTALNASTKISYPVVVTFKKVEATFYRQFGSPELIRPLVNVEVTGQTKAKFNETNNQEFRNLIFDHFDGHCIAWKCNDEPIEVYEPSKKT